MNKRIAILGASYLQKPLIEKANKLDIETHVFAWEQGAVAKDISDYFYPISILDKDQILKVCRKIKPNGITSIASDIAMPTVNCIASELGLKGNSLETTIKSTDKYEMRKALRDAGIPCPKFSFYNEPNFENRENLNFPLIVKPTDRSGSRGVTKVNNIDETNTAISKALNNSINKRVIVEEFVVSDREFSIEFISYNGKHYPLAITDKVTTGSPFFTEIEHHQPANIPNSIKDRMYLLTKDILIALGIENGASHTEVHLLDNKELSVIESAGRMGGDYIGSHMVQLSTGFDFLHATIDVALNQFNYNKYCKLASNSFSGVYYVTPKPGKIKSIDDYSANFQEVVFSEILLGVGENVTNIIDGSDKRAGIIVYSADKIRPIKNVNEILKINTVK
jgi:biotin carboxylase